MLIDARQIAPQTELRSQVCVVGAGPIGIAVALALADAGLEVIQLDSGGPEEDRSADELGAVAEISFGGVKSLGNTRQLGGNANAWQVRDGLSRRGVRMIPLTDADFEGHSGQPGSKWPFGAAELRPYLVRAQAFFALPQVDYRAESWARTDQAVQLVDEPDIRTGIFQFADGGELVSRSLATLRAHARIRVLHNATAMEVLTDDDGTRATGVRVATLPGREFVVAADQVVLAAGAATTTQLLLVSDRVHPAGLGNSSDLVGRYFMDHLLIRGGELHPDARTDLDHRDLYDLRVVRGTPILGHLQLTDDRLREEPALNLSFVMLPRAPEAERRRSDRQLAGVRAALSLRESLIRRSPPRAGVVRDLLRGLDGAILQQLASLRRPQASLGRGGWSGERGAPSRRFSHFEVMHQAEQAPHTDNRMTLSEQRDALGLRKLAIDWRWHDEDVAATVRAQETFREALKRIGWGDFRIALHDGRPVVHSHSSNHFMGTTRMNASARHGVVDEHGAVHGTRNLWVASSSVFPSGGFANVTLTAVAVALRTAEAIVAELRGLPFF